MLLSTSGGAFPLLTLLLALRPHPRAAEKVWPFAAPWPDPLTDPCSLVAAGRGRLGAISGECPSDCGDRSSFVCPDGSAVIPWWKVCDGVNDCAVPGAHGVPVGTHCGLALNTTTSEQLVLCSADEASCDPLLSRVMDGRVAGLEYDATHRVLRRHTIHTSVRIDDRVRVPLLDNLAHGADWNYFRMAIEGRHGGGLGCDAYYSDGAQSVVSEEPPRLTLVQPPDPKQGSAIIETRDQFEVVFHPCCGYRGVVLLQVLLESCDVAYETTLCAAHPIAVALTISVNVTEALPADSGSSPAPKPSSAVAAGVMMSATSVLVACRWLATLK
jgi:hypothetical protein